MIIVVVVVMEKTVPIIAASMDFKPKVKRSYKVVYVGVHINIYCINEAIICFTLVPFTFVSKCLCYFCYYFSQFKRTINGLKMRSMALIRC
jgi:hypothetical protein